MKRFLLLLLIVALIVAILAWVTGQRISAQASPVPYGPGEAAWLQPAAPAHPSQPAAAPVPLG